MSAYDDEDDYRTGTGDSFWSSFNRIVMALTIFALFALVIVMFVPKLREQQLQTARREQLTAQIEKEQEKLRRGQREVELLKNDPTYVETIARDRLDMMKPGETIIRLETPAPGKPPKAGR